MTQEDKLEKIIEKAIHGGFDLKNYSECYDAECYDIEGMIEDLMHEYINFTNQYNMIIFLPEFARAYWGEGKWMEYKDGLWIECDEPKTPKDKTMYVDAIWKHHQHQLLTEIQEGRDPIEYLYKFI